MKSPIKDRPLRNPGQSLDWRILAVANWLKQIIKESTGREFDVKKVVLFPGWFIEPTAESKQSDVWVLNPKALPAFISNSGVQLSGEEVGLVGFHLSRFVRATGDLINV